MEIMTFATTWTNLENTMLSETRQALKCICSVVCAEPRDRLQSDSYQRLGHLERSKYGEIVIKDRT